MTATANPPTTNGEPAAFCCSPLTADVLPAEDAEQLAAVLKALADPIRLRLVSIIAASQSGEVCACDFPQMLDRSQSTISHHLSQLTSAGLLRRTQRGKWAWFTLHHDRLAHVANLLCGTR